MTEQQTTESFGAQGVTPPVQEVKPRLAPKAKWLTFEYGLAMGSIVLAVLLVTSVLSAVFGGWVGNGSAVGYSGNSWLLGFFNLTMITAGTGVVVAGVAAVLLSLVALVCFGRVTKTIPTRPGYTQQTTYKTITYATLVALVLPALALVVKIVGILISSLLMIGVSNAGSVYKTLFLAECLPYAISLGVVAIAIMFVAKIVDGRNTSKKLSFVVLGAAAAVCVAAAITAAVQVRNSSTSTLPSLPSSSSFESYIKDLPSTNDTPTTKKLPSTDNFPSTKKSPSTKDFPSTKYSPSSDSLDSLFD